MRAQEIDERGALAPYFAAVEDGDTLVLRRARPARPSPVACYTPLGSGRFLRRVFDQNGELLSKEVVIAGGPCQCGRGHGELLAQKLLEMKQLEERAAARACGGAIADDPPEAEAPAADAGDGRDDQEYAGGYLPGGIGWFDDDGQPRDDRGGIPWRIDADEPAPGPGIVGLHGLAGSVPHDAEHIVRIAELETKRVLFAPRITGGYQDLFQEAFVAGLLEARKCSQLGISGERLERRVAKAVRHRLIDLVRRQEAVDRNLPQAEASPQDADGDDATTADPADPDGDPLQFLVSQERERARSRRDERGEMVLAAAYQEVRAEHLQSRGERRAEALLARRILHRLWDHIVLGKRTRGTLDFESHPAYRGATQIIKEAWGRAMSQVLSGSARTPRGRTPRAA